MSTPSDAAGNVGRKRLPLPCLMLVTEPVDDLTLRVAQALDGGVDVVQWRDKRKSVGKRAKVIAALASVTKDRALLIANGDWEANVREGVRKVHLPEKSLPVGVVKFRIGNGAMVGKSVHSVSAAVQAQAAGADYLVAGMIFESTSHPEVSPAGLDFLREVCAAVEIPVLAIGGVTPENTVDCLAAGAAGVAVLSSIMRATNPSGAARTYRTALDSHWEQST